MTAPLVLLHAFPFGPALWSPVVEQLEADPTWRRPILTPALPGFADTALPSSPPDLAATAHEIARTIGVDGPIVLGGVSLGGYVAMALAGQRPDLLAGLILVDTKAGADSPPAHAARLLMADQADQEPATVGPLLIAQLLPKLLSDQTFRDRSSVVDEVRNWLQHATPAAVAWYQRAMAKRTSSLDLLGALTCPTLVLYGDEDQLSPADQQDQMVAVLRKGQRQVIAGAGHLAPIEDPVSVARAISTFVAGCVAQD